MNSPHNETNARLPWLPVETEHLQKQYQRGVPIQKIADQLGRSYDSVSSRVGVLRLKRKPVQNK